MKKLVLLVVFCWLLLVNCLEPDKQFKDEDSATGYKLAQQYCQSCHLLPQATDLNKTTWTDFVLPKMGALLGYHTMGMNRYIKKEANPVLSAEEWDKIRHHFISEAPDSLIDTSNRKKILIGLSDFEIFNGPKLSPHPLTTFIAFGSEPQELIAGDGMVPAVYNTSMGKQPEQYPAGVGTAHIEIDSVWYILTMGVLQPSDSRMGTLKQYNPRTNTETVILDSLQRPVHFVRADLNQDSRMDIVLAEFGNETGRLSWFEQQADGSYIRHILRPLPGAIRIVITDWDKDHKPDILALMAQGDEGIYLYKNLGSGKFTETALIKFPAVYGSNYFELADFNGDALPDLVITNGDNGDYPPLLKPYHGIRIFQNHGNNKLDQMAFLPMNGVIKAMAADYNLDGIQDLAAISFFPDTEKTPEEAFILWYGQPGGSFNPVSFPMAKNGKWLTMDRADMDGDGDPDLVIGHASFGMGTGAQKSSSDSTGSWILLKNRKR